MTESASRPPQAGLDAAVGGGGVREALAAVSAFWAHWGFQPWRRENLAGVARRQHLVKDGFLGRIAEYGAWDYIVWEAGRAEDREALFRSLAPRPEIMTQRFLFVMPDPAPERRVKSFWLGFRGYAELYAYWPPGPAGRGAPPDLTGLVELALQCPGRDPNPAPGESGG